MDSSKQQWVVTCVVEGPDSPFDIVSDFLEDLRVRGNYNIISFVTTPASDIKPSFNNNHAHHCTSDNDDFSVGALADASGGWRYGD